MTVTLTREEAQQVLDALVFATPSGYGPTEVYKNSIVLLQNRLAKETPYEVGQRLYRQGLGISDIPTAVYSDSDIAEAYLGFEAARLNAPEPKPVRLRRGDILRCIETNELCTVWATSTTGKTQVKWKANDFGSYTAEQIGDLFWVEPKPEPEPVAWNIKHNRPPLSSDNPHEVVAVIKREWQGLTDEEIMDLCAAQWASHPIDVARIIEAKLKEKNND
jgi:hypothetical protein